jgi:tetratricopeptide (TPR) repeat protein
MQYSLTSALLTALVSFSAMVGAADAPDLTVLPPDEQEEVRALLDSSPDDPTTQLTIAELFEPTDLKEAERWIDKALASQPDNAEAHYRLGRIKGRQAQAAGLSALRLARQSKAAFEKAVDLAPTSARYLQGLINFHLAAPSIAGGDLGEAEQLASRLTGVDAVEGSLARARIASARSDIEKAIDILERAGEEHPDSPALAFNLGLYRQQQQDYEGAYSSFEQASLSTDDAHLVIRFLALYQLGRTAVLSGSHTQEGIDALSTYIAAAPEHEDLIIKPWAEFRLALLLEQYDQGGKARVILERLKDTEDTRLRREVRETLSR